MFKVNFKLVLMAVAVITMGVAPCKKDDPKPNPADKSALTTLIAECEALVNAEGVADDYPAAAIEEFNAVITTAKAVAADENAAQTAVNNAVTNLNAAREAFLAKSYSVIPATALILGLSFDETVADGKITTAGKGLVAELKTGANEIFGSDTQLPTFVDGKVGKAASLAKGAHFEIPTYTAADFESKTLSVAVWVKPTETRAGNYIVSYNYWNSWKFNLQTENKPFFTVKTELGHVDADNETPESAPNGQWTHLVVALDLNAHTLSFYVNGTLSKTWDAAVKENLGGNTVAAYGTTLPFMIGTATTYAEANTAWDWAWERTPEAWGRDNDFYGLLDELKVYNIALTAGQIAKLYRDENR